MSIGMYFCVFIPLFIDLILGINYFISETETVYILFLLLPVSSFACLSRPTKNSTMKRHVLSPKYLPYLNHAIFLLKASLIKILLAACVLYGVKIYYYRAAIKYFREHYPSDYLEGFKISPGEHVGFYYEMN
jgi:hypothetical protein